MKCLRTNIGEQSRLASRPPQLLCIFTNKLVLMNLTSEKHYFSAPGFAAAVSSRKVETKSAEIKGSIREIEVKAGGKAEWFFVPVKTGSYRLECTIPGHAKAGMTGTLLIK